MSAKFKGMKQKIVNKKFNVVAIGQSLEKHSEEDQQQQSEDSNSNENESGPHGIHSHHHSSHNARK